jgi:hypothetical protein
LIKVRVESDYDLFADSQGRGPQVAARAHGGFKNLIPVSGVGCELKLFFAFGNNYGCRRI